MKRNIIISLALIVVLLQGCIVKSIHPFFKDQDLISKKELLNTWIDQDGSQWTIKPYKDKPGAYEMHWLHNGENDVVMLAHLFKLNNETYMDFLPMSDNSPVDMPIFNFHLLPTHSVAKIVSITNDDVQIKWFNAKWLATLFEQNRIRISHEVVTDAEMGGSDDDKEYILTASTDELQKFMIKYGGEDKAFDDPNNTVWLRLKRAN